MSWKLFWMAVCIGLVASTLFAENPFVGKWKIDVANSHMTGTTDSVTAEGPNQWKFQDGSVFVERESRWQRPTRAFW
jgi:hypothetical protein